MRCFSPRSSQFHSSRAHDARHEVERERTLGAGRVAVDVERDAELHEDAFGSLLTPLQLAVAERADRVEQELRLGAWLPRLVEHLVVEPAGVVPVDVHLEPLPWTRPRATQA